LHRYIVQLAVIIRALEPAQSSCCQLINCCQSNN